MMGFMLKQQVQVVFQFLEQIITGCFGATDSFESVILGNYVTDNIWPLAVRMLGLRAKVYKTLSVVLDCL